MTEVSWHPLYDLKITGVDGEQVYHLRQALLAYRDKVQLSTAHAFNQIIETCENIEQIDEGN